MSIVNINNDSYCKFICWGNISDEANSFLCNSILYLSFESIISHSQFHSELRLFDRKQNPDDSVAISQK
jgi:hypothetical protein